MNVWDHRRVREKLPDLPAQQIRLLIQQADLHIEQSAARIAKHKYTPERMEKYGRPYMERWEAFREELRTELGKRAGTA